jgi:hypothetical protein
MTEFGLTEDDETDLEAESASVLAEAEEITRR